MARSQDMMTCQGPPLKNVIINVCLTTTEVLTCTKEVKVLKQKEDAVEIEKNLMTAAPIKKLRSIETDKQMENDLETPAENIQPVPSVVMFIATTIIVGVVVHLLMWKEDVKTEVTLVNTLAVRRLRSSKI